MSGPAARVEGLARTFPTPAGPVAALRGVDLEVPAGALVALLGASGSGKSTVLRCIAGLERPDAGRILVGGRTMTDIAGAVDVPTHRRGVGMVFQGPSLWPHLTVVGNVAYPSRVRGCSRADARTEAERALAMVGLDGYARRRTAGLSGGEQQRVALARAIVTRPALLLLDEPLSSLDTHLRRSLQTEVRSLQREVGIATLLVTHDRREALRMADELVVLDRGRVVQSGRPEELHRAPRHRAVAELLGPVNLLEAMADAPIRAGTNRVLTAFGPVLATAPEDARTAGRRAVVAVRPDAVRVGRLAEGRRPGDPGVAIVVDAAHIGTVIEYRLRRDGIEVDGRGPMEEMCAVGAAVSVTLGHGALLPAAAGDTGHPE